MKWLLIIAATFLTQALSQTIDFTSPSLLNGPYRVSPQTGLYLTNDAPELRQTSLLSFTATTFSLELLFYSPDPYPQG